MDTAEPIEPTFIYGVEGERRFVSSVVATAHQGVVYVNCIQEDPTSESGNREIARLVITPALAGSLGQRLLELSRGDGT